MTDTPRELLEALDAEWMARTFHEAYERMAPRYGYETRKDSAVPWDEVPQKNRDLMRATCSLVASAIAGRLAADARRQAGEVERLREALEAIRDCEPESVPDMDPHPADCPECLRYRDHPVQQGICDARWRQIHRRESDVRRASASQHWTMRRIARAALDAESAPR